MATNYKVGDILVSIDNPEIIVAVAKVVEVPDGLIIEDITIGNGVSTVVSRTRVIYTLVYLGSIGGLGEELEFNTTYVNKVCRPALPKEVQSLKTAILLYAPKESLAYID